MAADQGAAAAPAAVILAAGLGSRLRSAGGPPKPLTKVLGLSLAERTVCTLLAVGVRRFVVVLGYDAQAIRPHFAEIARRREAEITCLEAENWELGNGASALAAESATEGMCFLLVMADHLVDPEIVTSLIKDPPAPGEICLAVDRNKSGIFDLDDVTRIRLDGARLTDIGKNLPDWEAADTGVFLCTSGLFEGLRRAKAKDRHGLSDGAEPRPGRTPLRRRSGRTYSGAHAQCGGHVDYGN